MTSPIPTSVESTRAHSNSDLDSSFTAQHHSLGIGHNQAAPGDHDHDGKNSKRIGKGLDLTFPTTAAVGYVQADFQKVINALRSIGFGT